MYSLEELRAQREELEARNISNMTVRELQQSLEQLHNLDRMINLRQPGMNRSVYKHSYISHVKKESIDADNIKQPESLKQKMLEQNVGRYVMTVLAAGLCLLALGVFIMSFWTRMSDLFKFSFFITIGVLAEFLGFFMASRNNMRPFWLGFAGLGAGSILLILISGSIVWSLYDIVMASLLILFWFAINFVLAYKQKAVVFYAIAYIGGLVTVWIASKSVDTSIGSEIVLSIILFTTICIGLIGSYVVRRAELLLANMLYCCVSGVLVVRAYSDLKYNMTNWGTVTSYTPLFISWFLVIVAAISLFNTRFLFKSTRREYLISNVVIVFINSCFVAGMCGFASKNELAAFITIVIIAVCFFKSCSGYLLGVVPIVISALMEISWDITSLFNVDEIKYTCEALFPCILSAILCTIPFVLKRKIDRIAAVISFFAATYLSFSFTHNTRPHFYIVCFSILYFSLMIYMANVKTYSLYFNEAIDKLVISICPALLLYILCSIDLVPDTISLVAASVGLQAYGVFYLFRCEEENRGTPYVLWCILRVIIYILMIGSTIFPSDKNKIVLTVGFMIILVFNLYRMVTAPSALRAVLSCIIANWHMWIIINLWDLNTQLLLSLIGLLIGTGFIICGFVLHIKTARQCGLACCILYVIKMGLVDVSRGGLSTAVGLLFAGLVCFGISLIYNKMLKVYDNSEES